MKPNISSGLVPGGHTMSAPLHAQRPATASPDSPSPLLTLDDAVSLALENNRVVKNSSLEARKFDLPGGHRRSRRLPQFNFSVLGGELCSHSISPSCWCLRHVSGRGADTR